MSELRNRDTRADFDRLESLVGWVSRRSPKGDAGVTHHLFDAYLVGYGPSALTHPTHCADLIGTCSLADASVVDHLVGRGPEVEIDTRRNGGIPEALGHQDRDHLLRGVRIPRRAVAAVPAVP